VFCGCVGAFTIREEVDTCLNCYPLVGSADTAKKKEGKSHDVGI
jgi:hypothetical protein